MESTLHKLEIQTIKAQLGLRKIICSSLATDFTNENLTFAQKTDIVNRYNAVKRVSRELQLLLEEQEREQAEREAECQTTV